MKNFMIELCRTFLNLTVSIRFKKSDVEAQALENPGDGNTGSSVNQTTNFELISANKKWRAVPSSRFFSHSGQLNAYNEAMTREARNMPRFTGEDGKGNLLVRVEAENIGEGYEPNPLDPANPRYIPKMNGLEMKFDFETLKPIAFYPIEKI